MIWDIFPIYICILFLQMQGFAKNRKNLDQIVTSPRKALGEPCFAGNGTRRRHHPGATLVTWERPSPRWTCSPRGMLGENAPCGHLGRTSPSRGALGEGRRDALGEATTRRRTRTATRFGRHSAKSAPGDLVCTALGEAATRRRWAQGTRRSVARRIRSPAPAWGTRGAFSSFHLRRVSSRTYPAKL